MLLEQKNAKHFLLLKASLNIKYWKLNFANWTRTVQSMEILHQRHALIYYDNILAMGKICIILFYENETVFGPN